MASVATNIHHHGHCSSSTLSNPTMKVKNRHSNSNTEGGDSTTGNLPCSTVRVYGSSATIPDCDYCRLSYYLKCCIVGCGIDNTIDETLLDYQTSQERFENNPMLQEELFQLCYDTFRAEQLLNRRLYLDDEHLLMPMGVSNVFYHVSELRNTISTTATTNHQQHPQVNNQKVMLCTSQWLNVFYCDPMTRLIPKHITATTTCCNNDDDGDDNDVIVPTSVPSNGDATTTSISCRDDDDAVLPDMVGSDTTTGTSCLENDEVMKDVDDKMMDQVVESSMVMKIQFQPEQTIRLQNVTNFPDANGLLGHILEIQDDRHLVHVPYFGILLSLQSHHLQMV